MNRYVIIVAGGKGTRFGAEKPKQFLLLNGLPVLMQTINLFKKFDANLKIIITLPADFIDYWHELCEKYGYTVEHSVIQGGETRFHSVKNGLSLVSNVGIIAVHDAVRPLTSTETLRRCFDTAEKEGNAIPVIKITDSLREIEKDYSTPVDREKYVAIQTPQIFDAELLHKAYQQGYNPLFTDDASVVEALGTKINLVDGNKENIKITSPIDLALAEILFQRYS